MTKQVTLMFFLLLSFFSVSQSLRHISTFPVYLNENSGIITQSKNSAWIHNDSGDGPIIYKIDSNGIQQDSIYLNGVTAIDFEDITQDLFGNIFIGDIGNNNHNRTNLVVYKIPNPNSISGSAVTPEEIHFSYSDQTQFPDPNQNSDCEALFHYNNHLYLISKNWGSSGYSKLYELPDSAGSYVAQLIDSFASPMVTAADYHPSGKLAVLSMDRVTVFDQFVGNNFFDGRASTFYFSLSQKEAVSFVTASSLYITQEHHRFFPGAKLYELNFSSYLSLTESKDESKISISPNPVADILTLIIDINSYSQFSYFIYSSEGTLVKKGTKTAKQKTKIRVNELKTGMYFLAIKTNKTLITKRFIKN